MPKKKKKDNYDDSWMYILLLTTLTILTYSLHPNEDEITLKNTSNIKIIKISKYFED